METFSDIDLLEPIDLYNKRLKDAFHENAIKYFEELKAKGEVNEELNQAACKKYYRYLEDVAAAEKALNKAKTIRKVKMFFGVILAIAIIGIFLIISAKKDKEKIKDLEADLDKKMKQRDEALQEAYASMEGINKQIEWNMAAKLMSETTPLIQLDQVFDGEKFQYLHEKYGFMEDSSTDTSSVFVQSGSILGNPFIFEKNYCQTMVDHTYEGTRTVTYTRTVRTSKGTSTQVVTETLKGYVTKPKPAYFYDTVLIYGNEAAPRLSFSRTPTNINSMNDKQIEKYVKSFDKKLDKLVQQNLSKGGNFTRLANEEFEALFNALDRDNETEFRILFTPLGQRNMIKLLKSKDTAFGDDFAFRKSKMLNFVRAGHMQGSDSLDRNPKSLLNFDYKNAKEAFVAYCDKYLKDIFFNLAPVISIPVYQQHKSSEYIYEGKFSHNVTQAEAESAANSHDINLFKHPATRSDGVILKSRFNAVVGEADLCTVDAHSFSGTDMVTNVMVRAGNGRMYDVPVRWVDYQPISKSTQFVVSDSKKDLAGYNELVKTGKFNEMINKFSGNSDIIYKKRLFSFVLKDNK